MSTQRKLLGKGHVPVFVVNLFEGGLEEYLAQPAEKPDDSVPVIRFDLDTRESLHNIVASMADFERVR